MVIEFNGIDLFLVLCGVVLEEEVIKEICKVVCKV